MLGPLLFLIYVTDMPTAMKCNLFLHINDLCLVSQSSNGKDIKMQLNQDFANICDWFVDKKLSIHFGDDSFFASKCKIEMIPMLDIIYNNIQTTIFK